uniref:VPS9 domain-containing protein n=1 Tax=Pyramimonas obovata TaxID=1411642 RepID=A0A7S0WUR0_9CHLO|mmetsp:Transcript_5166/g.10559  ORF Transcript_5166/g.10559 Transcript_5166/m.10559 type:complete len:606 (+) Transcript_5166:379-2196(+)|eukprot:CAMPEP_0118952674 /NCGR_PEP_ID=MMETSP1169-20130426/55258_1 /TAXON_ID=36882 /ORGANISM="Pyramimonas obovata, Strain CCMP722" /LENGTH=605 /DNA_ID=CAMNT_0006899979 /DNA_START=365 /DNA_END=2182 /DNA_ORIENTATION=-
MEPSHTQGQEPSEHDDDVFAKLQDFFPSINGEIIKDVLFANNGAIEPTIDQLLRLAEESGGTPSSSSGMTHMGDLLMTTADDIPSRPTEPLSSRSTSFSSLQNLAESEADPPPLPSRGGRVEQWEDELNSNSNDTLVAAVQQQQQMERDEALALELWNLELENAQQRQSSADLASTPSTSDTDNLPAPQPPLSSSPQSSLLGIDTMSVEALTGAFKGFMARQNNQSSASVQGSNTGRVPEYFKSPTQGEGQGRGSQLLQAPLKILQGIKKTASQGSDIDGAAGKDGVVSKVRGDIKLGEPSQRKRAPSGLLSHQIVDVEACKNAIFRWPGGPTVLLEAERMAQSFCRVRQKLEASQKNSAEVIRNKVKVLEAWRQTLHTIVEQLLKQLALEAVKQQPLRARLAAVMGDASFVQQAHLVDVHQMAIMREALETVIMERVHDEVWPAMLALNQQRQAPLQRVLSALRNAPAKRLGVDPKHAQVVTAPLIAKLQTLSEQRTPRAMGVTLVSTMQMLMASAAAAPSTKVVSADDLLPLTAWLVVQSQPLQMFAVIQYIELFSRLNGQPVSGELAYILTNFMAACEWLCRGAPGVEEPQEPPSVNLIDFD